MNALERAKVRFAAAWVEVYPNTPVTEDIVLWYNCNHSQYATVKFDVSNNCWRNYAGERLNQKTGHYQDRLNTLINEASIVEIQSRTQVDDNHEYW